MSNFKYEKIPAFTKRKGDSIVYDSEGELIYFVPEDYFGHKSAIIEGSYVKLLGSFLYKIYTDNGKSSEPKLFNWPTMFYCKPSSIKKVKDIVIKELSDEPMDCRLLHFEKGDELVTNVFTPQDIDNVSEVLRLHVRTGRIPNIIPYNTLYKFLYDALDINGASINIHSQAYGLVYSKLARDPDNDDELFRRSKAIKESMIGYKTISVHIAAKRISPFVSLTSENMDEAIMSAVMMSDEEESGKRKHKYSPLERVMTM